MFFFLFLSLGWAASFCSVASSHKMTTGGSKLDLSSAGENRIQAWTRSICVKDKWLDLLYKENRNAYLTWVPKEQKRLGWQVMMSHGNLRGCFRNWLNQPDSDLGAKCRRDEISWIMDFLAAEMEYRAISSKDQAAMWNKGCEIRNKYFAKTSGEAAENSDGLLTTVNFLISGNSPHGDSCGKLMAQATAALHAPAKVVFDRQIKFFGDKCDPLKPASALLPEAFEMARQVAEAVLKNKPMDLVSKWVLAGTSARGGEAGMSSCPQLGKIEKAEESFPLLRAEYCEDEAKAYQSRTDQEKKKVRRLIKQHFRAQCKGNPAFQPAEWNAKTEKWIEEVKIVVKSPVEPPQALPPRVPPPVRPQDQQVEGKPVVDSSAKKEMPKRQDSDSDIIVKKLAETRGKTPNRKDSDSDILKGLETPGKKRSDSFVIGGNDETPGGKPSKRKGSDSDILKGLETPGKKRSDSFVIGGNDETPGGKPSKRKGSDSSVVKKIDETHGKMLKRQKETPGRLGFKESAEQLRANQEKRTPKGRAGGDDGK